MNGKHQHLRISLPLILLAVASGAVGVAGYRQGDRPSSTARFYLESPAGAVFFEHDLHIEMTAGCETCHHALLSSDSRNSCADCHDADVAADDFEHEDLKTVEAHTCETCHRLNPQSEARSCRACHPEVQAEKPGFTGCQDCHDADYTPDLLTHDEMQEIEGHSCDGCHSVSTIKAVVHEQCRNCHGVENADRFMAEDGSVRCEICHLK